MVKYTCSNNSIYLISLYQQLNISYELYFLQNAIDTRTKAYIQNKVLYLIKLKWNRDERKLK